MAPQVQHRSVLPDGTVMLEQVPSDSAPLVRADFERRHVDTITWLHTTAIPRSTASQRMGTPVTFKVTVNPLPAADQWTLLADGTVAIVGVRDYHVDWIGLDGKRTSSGRLPFDWRRIDDVEKQSRIDSAVAAAQQAFRTRPVTPGSPVYEYTGAKLSDVPDYLPPLALGVAILVDSAGRLWTLPTTSTAAGNGLVYDVIARSGLVERVRLPVGRELVALGRHSAYMTHVDSGVTRIERVLLR
jgi:hypothetical protein